MTLFRVSGGIGRPGREGPTPVWRTCEQGPHPSQDRPGDGGCPQGPSHFSSLPLTGEGVRTLRRRVPLYLGAGARRVRRFEKNHNGGRGFTHPPLPSPSVPTSLTSNQVSSGKDSGSRIMCVRGLTPTGGGGRCRF